MNLLLRLSSLMVIAVCSLGANLRAEEQNSTHCIIGLFDPERKDDLRECVKTMPDVQLVKLDYDTAEATFRYDVAKVIAGYNPKKPPTDEAIARHLDELLRTASNGTFTLKPGATIPKDKLEAIAIKVGILDCRGCRYGAYLAIAKIEGVERANINAETHTLTAWIDAAKTNRAALEDALKKARVELPAP